MGIKLVIILVAIFLGLCAFAISGGAFIFAALLTRKGVENLAGRKPSGGRAQNEGPLSAHLHDPKIAPVMEAARERWNAALAKGTIERVRVTTRGGLPLTGYVALPAQNPRSPPLAVILIHGYTDRASSTAYLAEEYLARGAAVLAVDCRAHGESGGEVICMGYTDARDIALWCNVLLERFGKDARVALHGISMGGAAAMHFTALKVAAAARGNLAAVIADCGFSSSAKQFLNMAELIVGTHPAQKAVSALIFAGMSVINFAMAGFFLFQNSPERSLKKRVASTEPAAPLLLFHGGNDRLVKTDMLDSLVKAAGGKNVVVEKIDDAPHMGCYFYAPARYMEKVFAAIDG